VKRQSKTTTHTTNRPHIPDRSNHHPLHIERTTRIRSIIRECRHCVGEIHGLLIEVLVVIGIIGSLLWLVHHELVNGRP
jgi:hypothetical protein